MARTNFFQNSFAGGELSPLMEGRQDMNKYPVSARRLRNFFPLVQGPARKRAGTLFIAEVADSTERGWLYPFVFNETDALVLEFADLEIRFFRSRAAVLSGMSVYTVTSPWAISDLTTDEGTFNLKISQSGDVLYITGAGQPPQKLSRYGLTSWQLTEYDPADGPFDPQNIDDSISVLVSAATGTVTLTNDSAGVPVAEGAESVGRLIRIDETDKSDIPPWEPNKQIAKVGQNPLGQVRRSDNKVYECATNDTVGGAEVEFRTGTIKPIHTEGTEADGDGNEITSGSTVFAGRAGLDWTFLHAGYGVGRIASVSVGGATASVTTLSRWPASVVSPGSYRWSLGAWRDGNYPTANTFFRDRLFFSLGQRVFGSVAGDYESHAPDEFGEVLADSAIDVVVSVGQVDQIKWIIGQKDALIIGTGGAELALREITGTQVLGPENVKFEIQSSYGSRDIQPLNVAEYTLFVQAGGRVLREAQYSIEADRYIAQDMTVLAEHITESGINWLQYSQNPNSTVWCGLENGKLAAMTYQRDQDVYAWSLHTTLGAIESGASIPADEAGQDDLYLIVRRNINGQTKRYVEVLTPSYDGEGDPWLACYVDCAVTYNGSRSGDISEASGVVTCTAGSFVVGDVGKYIIVRSYDEDDEVWSTERVLITGYTSATQVTVDGSLPDAASGSWYVTTTTVTGLSHLEGETVQICANGARVVDAVVSGGQVTLPQPAGVAHVGLGYTAYVEPMPLEFGAVSGLAQARTKRVHKLWWRLWQTLGGKFGPSFTALDSLNYRTANVPLNQGPPLFSGDIECLWPNGYETRGRLLFVHDEPFPATVIAYYGEMETAD